MGICVSALSKRFSDQKAIDGVSFELPQNAFFCVVGASGCGKSTLLRLIAGLETPDSGRIQLSGRTVFDAQTNVLPEDRKVGVVFQSYALWPHLSVAKNVAFPYEARGFSAQDTRDHVAEHLERVALTAFADRKPEALSGGQRQRVALARCLAGDTDTILMDEPLANLDPHLRTAMESELRAFHERSGVTTLYITHDQREAMALADVMAVMDNGRFLQIGSPQDIYARPETEKVARFIGRGSLINADVKNGRATIQGQSFSVEGNGSDKVFIRPKMVSVAEGGVRAQISAVHFRGGCWEVEAHAENIAEPIALDLDQPAKVGDNVTLKFNSGWVLPR